MLNFLIDQWFMFQINKSVIEQSEILNFIKQNENVQNTLGRSEAALSAQKCLFTVLLTLPSLFVNNGR